jgi:uncharacterized protein YdbL (DUF1318 family)
MSFTRRFFLVLMLALLPVAVLPAHALELDAAKAQGLVGEKPDGLLGSVGSPSPEVQALVSDVNNRRLTVFRGIAAKNGQALAAVQAVSGEEFISRTPSGQYIMTAAGQWVKK